LRTFLLAYTKTVAHNDRATVAGDARERILYCADSESELRSSMIGSSSFVSLVGTGAMRANETDSSTRPGRIK
jgi:hypothetical protein